MDERSWTRGGIVPVLIVVMLVAMTGSQILPRFFETIGVDFYNFWGVPVAKRLAEGTLGSPYRDGQRYRAVLMDYGMTAVQPRLTAAQRFWGGPDYTATPLLYRVFGVVSDDYTRSLNVFRVLQIFSFLGACALLGSLYRIEPLQWLSFALICLLLYQPVLSDLRVANLGCLQFVVLAGLTGLAGALTRVRSSARRAALAASLGAGLAAVTLCKPNVALVGVLLAVHLAVRHGVGMFAMAALPAVVVSAALWAVSSLYFGSWTVWSEWYGFVYGTNARMLVRPVATGNYSTPLLASPWLGVDLSVIAGGLFVLLVVSLVVVALWPRGSGGALGRLFGNAHGAVAVAIVLTMATSPLAWVHYYVLVLIPSLWLLSPGSTSWAVPLLAAIGVLMSAGIVGLLLWGLGWAGAMPATIALCWIPLWSALLIKLRS